MKASYINILEDGTVLTTNWDREPGDRVLNPATQRMLAVKYALTKDQYDQCLEYQNELVEKYFKLKGVMLDKYKVFNEQTRAQVISTLTEDAIARPLGVETMFISMIKFK